MSRAKYRQLLTLFLLTLSLVASSAPVAAQASEDPAYRQSVSDAWWTGPIMAAGAETLPVGHIYFEPYVFDVITNNSSTPGSSSYLLYGVAPRFTAGLLPSFSDARDAAGKRRLQIGDLTLNFQYRLTAPNPRKTTPTIALVVQQKLSTASYDRLRVDGSAAGDGTHSTLLGLYGQQFFWLPNGRILRARFNFTHSFEDRVKVFGLSAYGTPQNFRGRVRPGDSTSLVLSAEYSATKRFVVALDLLRHWNGGTKVWDDTENRASTYASGSQWGAVPALEYNWSGREGIIFGTRWLAKGPNNPSSVTPVIAYSLFI